MAVAREEPGHYKYEPTKVLMPDGKPLLVQDLLKMLQGPDVGQYFRIVVEGCDCCGSGSGIEVDVRSKEVTITRYP